MDEYLQILNKYWGFSSFRPVQAEIVKSITQGKDTLGIMPTGGGKSITFQVPAMNTKGVCIVISPLIALMNDQVERLNSLGIKAAALHSGLTYPEIITKIDNAVFGAYKFLYISPERLATDVFRAKLPKLPVSLIAVDEAHCISQWGYDFRPSYLQIATLREYFPETPLMALTATATPEVIDDIQKKLQFKEKNVIEGDFTRKNLVFFVRKTDSKLADLVKVVKSIHGSGIVYLRNRKKTKEVAEHLVRHGIKADFYHAGLSYEIRNLKQESWSKNQVRIMVATNAFGMGIDKSDVRFVVHMDLPDSPEAYIQEAGRAGRDEKRAFAVLLVNNYDKTSAAQKLAVNFPEIKEIKRIYGAMANYLQVPIGNGKGIAYDFNLFDFATAYKLNSVIAYNALKFLEKHGYIELTDEINNPSRILFTLNRDDLYKFQIQNQKFDGFIKLLLRSYTGLFSDYTKIDEDLIAKRANIKRDLVYQYLVKLSQMKVISFIPSRKTPLLILTEERLDEKSIHISYEFYNDRKERFKKRLDGMLQYAFSEEDCRNNLILKYFGKPTGTPCGACDICKSRLEDDDSPQRMEQTKADMINLLAENPMYLGEIQLALEKKEAVINTLAEELLREEKIHYMEDGRIALNE